MDNVRKFRPMFLNIDCQELDTGLSIKYLPSTTRAGSIRPLEPMARPRCSIGATSKLKHQVNSSANSCGVCFKIGRQWLVIEKSKCWQEMTASSLQVCNWFKDGSWSGWCWYFKVSPSNKFENNPSFLDGCFLCNCIIWICCDCKTHQENTNVLSPS